MVYFVYHPGLLGTSAFCCPQSRQHQLLNLRSLVHLERLFEHTGRCLIKVAHHIRTAGLLWYSTGFARLESLRCNVQDFHAYPYLLSASARPQVSILKNSKGMIARGKEVDLIFLSVSSALVHSLSKGSTNKRSDLESKPQKPQKPQ